MSLTAYYVYIQVIEWTADINLHKKPVSGTFKHRYGPDFYRKYRSDPGRYEIGS